MPSQPQSGGAAPAQQGEREEGSNFMGTIMRSVAIFLFVQLAQRGISEYYKQPSKGGAEAPPKAQDVAFDEGQTRPESGRYLDVPTAVNPIWPTQESLDVKIYVSPSLAMPPLNRVPTTSLILDEKEFGLGNWSDNRVIETTFPVPPESANAGTLWAHMYIAIHGYEIDPSSSNYDWQKAYHQSRPLNQVLPKRKEVKTKKLLGGSDEIEEEAVEEPISGQEAKFASYYHPNFTLAFVPDSGTVAYTNVHPAVRSYLNLDPSGRRDPTGQNGWYYPIFYMNTFWQLREHMREMNKTVKELPIRIELNNLANWKFNLYASVDENNKANARNVANGATVGMAGDGSEFEEFKRILVDSNPYLLGTTFFVSIFHMIFEMLAFKNDVSHWRNKKDNVGISFRTILANIVMQAIIFLYLMDNNENTSWMILMSQGMGILIEAWKITKTVDVKLRPSTGLLPYKISFEDKHQLSETEKKTQEYDEIAFRYLYIVAVPLLLAYAGYSVVYESHKSWYSFVITTLVGSVYAYGFLMMVPSLYINYRLQSVAHMPGKAMTYKFLNTFIDDLFAFTIKMPTLHRLATLRDDVIFFVYLYQCYVYKIDYSRVNEFGQGGEDEELEEKKANKPLTAAPDADANPGNAATASGKDVGSAKKRK